MIALLVPGVLMGAGDASGGGAAPPQLPTLGAGR